MVQINYIDITGIVETLPKWVKVGDKDCCEFLLQSRAWVQSKNIKESFSIPVIVSRKYAKKANKKLQKGIEINIEGSLSWANDPDRCYQGFYINVEKLIGG